MTTKKKAAKKAVKHIKRSRPMADEQDYNEQQATDEQNPTEDQPPTREEFDELKAQVEEMQRLLDETYGIRK